MPLRIYVEADTERVEKALRALKGRVENLRPVFQAIGVDLVSSTQKRFDDGVDPDGNPWLPSARALRDGGKTLIDTGALRNSITSIATKDELQVGSFVNYASDHQFGERGLPVRAFIGLSQQDETLVLSRVTEALEAAIESGT